MLLRFEFSNFLSIKSNQEISLIATSLKDEPSYKISREGFKEEILPCLGIYGANASGKTNTLKAFYFFRSAILNSHTNGTPGGGIPRKPFLLDMDSEDLPSSFDCDVLIDNVRYHYGFVVNNDVVLGEWLYSFPEGHRRILFDRDIDNEEKFVFGRYLKGKNRTIEELTRENSLFLSAAAQNNHEELSIVYNYFKNNFEFRKDIEPKPEQFLAKYLDDTPVKDKIMEFLKVADIGISEVKIEEMDLDEVTIKIQKDLDEVFNKHFGGSKKVTSPDRYKLLKLGHSRTDGESTFFDLKNESRGTRCLLSLVGPILDALSHGKTFFVDEIGSSMHPRLTQKLVSLFVSEDMNPHGAQLIFTTHDATLLCCGLLRRDEIWFTEKLMSGETRIYPLSDFKTRSGDNFEKGYLQGSFKSTPFLDNIDELIRSWSES